jgi:hypothetical protein
MATMTHRRLTHRQRNPATPPIARQAHPRATVVALMIAVLLFLLLVCLRVVF